MLTRRKQSDYQQQLLWNYYDSFVFVFNFHLSAFIAHNFQSNAKSRFALWFLYFYCLVWLPPSLYIYISLEPQIYLKYNSLFFSFAMKQAHFTHFTFYFLFRLALSLQSFLFVFFIRYLFIRHDETDKVLKAFINFYLHIQ